MKKSLLLVIPFLLMSVLSFGQISISGSVGVDGTYTSITNASGAFAAINGTAQTGARRLFKRLNLANSPRPISIIRILVFIDK